MLSNVFPCLDKYYIQLYLIDLFNKNIQPEFQTIYSLKKYTLQLFRAWWQIITPTSTLGKYNVVVFYYGSTNYSSLLGPDLDKLKTYNFVFVTLAKDHVIERVPVFHGRFLSTKKSTIYLHSEYHANISRVYLQLHFYLHVKAQSFVASVDNIQLRNYWTTPNVAVWNVF